MRLPHDKELHQRLGDALRGLRKERGLSLETVCQRSSSEDGQLARNYLSRVERGENSPSFNALAGIARGLGMTVSELLRRLARDLG